MSRLGVIIAAITLLVVGSMTWGFMAPVMDNLGDKFDTLRDNMGTDANATSTEVQAAHETAFSILPYILGGCFILIILWAMQPRERVYSMGAGGYA